MQEHPFCLTECDRQQEQRENLVRAPTDFRDYPFKRNRRHESHLRRFGCRILMILQNQTSNQLTDEILNVHQKIRVPPSLCLILREKQGFLPLFPRSSNKSHLKHVFSDADGTLEPSDPVLIVGSICVEPHQHTKRKKHKN